MSAIDDLLVYRLVHYRIAFDAQLVISGVLVHRAIELHPCRVFQGEVFENRVGITDALVIVVDTNIIQVVVESFYEPFHWHTTPWKRPHPIHPFPYLSKMLTMIKRIRQTFGIIIIVIVYCIDDSVIRNANVICRQRIKTRNILKSRKIIAIACTDHITIWVELHIPNPKTFKSDKFPVLHVRKG